MSTTRRTILGSTLAAPLLAAIGGPADAATQRKWGTASAAWVEVRWTRQTQRVLDWHKAVLEAISPATLSKDKQTVRFPVRSGTGDPAPGRLSQAQGSGVLDGGLVLRTSSGRFRITDLESDLRDEVVYGESRINGIKIAKQPLLRYNLEEGRLIAAPVAAGQPQKMRIERVPVWPTRESLKVFTDTFDDNSFTTESVLAHLTVEGTYRPPGR